MKYILTILLFVLIFFTNGKAQDTTRYQIGKNVLYGIVSNGDTLLISSIDPVYIFPKRKFKSESDYKKYLKLIRNVKKVYPYAKLAKRKYDEVNAKYASLKTEKEKREYMRQVEQEVKDQFEDDLKKLTITQGRILIKLIDRELGSTSYEVVKELRGSFSAIFWQTIARVFGSNLKSEFDEAGEDKLINEIIIMIELGAL